MFKFWDCYRCKILPKNTKNSQKSANKWAFSVIWKGYLIPILALKIPKIRENYMVLIFLRVPDGYYNCFRRKTRLKHSRTYRLFIEPFWDTFRRSPCTLLYLNIISWKFQLSIIIFSTEKHNSKLGSKIDPMGARGYVGARVLNLSFYWRIFLFLSNLAYAPSFWWFSISRWVR